MKYYCSFILISYTLNANSEYQRKQHVIRRGDNLKNASLLTLACTKTFLYLQNETHLLHLFFSSHVH